MFGTNASVNSSSAHPPPPGISIFLNRQIPRGGDT